MKSENFSEKFKNFCQKVGKRNFIIFGAVLLIGAAIVVNFLVMSAQNNDGYDYDKSAGMQDTSSPATDVGNNEEIGDDEYFSSIEVSRKRSRDEAIEVLQSVVDSQSSTEAAKNEALLEIAGLAILFTTGNGDTIRFMAAVSVIGICFGALMGVYPGFTADQFGPRNNSVNYGIMFIGFAIAGYFGPSTCGKLLASTGSYGTAFIVSMILALLGISLTFAFNKIKKHS